MLPMKSFGNCCVKIALRAGSDRRVFNDHSSYNPIFEKLVDEEKDLILGLVAYGCKIAKREWAESVRVNTGCGPSPDQLRAYVKLGRHRS